MTAATLRNSVFTWGLTTLVAGSVSWKFKLVEPLALSVGTKVRFPAMIALAAITCPAVTATPFS